MTGEEHLSTLPAYQLDLISESRQPIRHEDLLGQPVTVRLELPDDQDRYLNGIISRFAHTGFDGDLTCYQATLVPWLWLLTRTTDCRIFQDQTVPDIIKALFREHGYTDFEECLATELYCPRSYCVQYRETDFAFISRLLEQEGIYYYFKHENGKHTLVLADSYGAHDTIPGYEAIPYYPPDETARRERDHIHDWSVAGSLQSGAFAYTDFDDTAPRKRLLTMRHHPHEHARRDLERFDYPGGYTQYDQGDDWGRVRMEAQHVDYETAQGAGNARGLATGALFTLTGYPRQDQNREYLIISTEYQLQSDAFGSSSAADAGPVFHCEFTALDAKTPYRPPRNTPKARVQGPQTAIVVGPAGQEIWTDKYGRVKVQFHWDRYGQSDEKSSCWVRVSQPWAGKGWGTVAIPRIGQEVIVDFLEGDPDRPIITGRVYNDVNTPPWELPANMTQSGILSRSSKGGSGANANAIRMEDKKGAEQLWIHAEKDQDSEVENDETHWVGHDRTKTIDNDETSHIKHDRTETVDNDETLSIHGKRTETVDKDETITIHRNRTETVDQNETITIHGARTERVDKNETITIDGGRTETVAEDETITIKGGRIESVTKNESITISGGRTESVAKDESVSISGARSHSVTKDDSLKVGKNLVIDAGDAVTIRTGKASISMNKDGTITIQGKDITVKGSGGINAKATKNVVIKGKKILEN